MPRKPRDPESEQPALLLIAQERFAGEIAERIRLGKDLLERHLESLAEVKAAESDYYTWNEYNEELLRRRFTTSEVAEGYSESVGFFVLSEQSLGERIDEHREEVRKKLRRLQSIRERVELYEMTAQAEAETRTATVAREKSAPATIFIVHGHDEVAKLSVQGFVRDVTDLVPVILHDEPNRGRTVIEKFEAVASAAAFAIVLLTPDDVGGPKTEDMEMSPRARQNVVFELGFFVGVLGRARVAVLHTGDLDLPSDVAGIVYIPLDEHGAWKIGLARELKDAGVDVDANRLL